jgi:hypothetical protein
MIDIINLNGMDFSTLDRDNEWSCGNEFGGPLRNACAHQAYHQPPLDIVGAESSRPIHSDSNSNDDKTTLNNSRDMTKMLKSKNL